ncbi:uncharacterized protein LOC122066483 isoform X2 [Macadamia integrifolia]|uniref:uncharacterized protein LOC122066483 isoform X2 n=1 Tax=Macadamia integrifolia TaxID=60698 RepID=UPI001C4FA4D3|nr:uncharacterized protein LOC122066483 isoform X2 [Macadamia integrifolia]
MAAIGWYGPLIDLSKAVSHIGDYVQLLVFVHKSRPIQLIVQRFKFPKEGELVRTDIQVGDDTRPFFSVSLWQKQIGSMVFAGDVILLQNVKVVRFGEFIEARTVQLSSLLRLVHPYELLISKDDLLADCRVGKTTKGKLRRVIEWVQQVGSTVHVGLHTYQRKKLLKNWKVHEDIKYVDCVSISEVSCLTKCCNVSFFASVGGIFMPSSLGNDERYETERMFIGRRLFMKGDNKIADLICTGCSLCGSPMVLDNGSFPEKNMLPLYCQKSSNHLHAVCLIYRPFLLYVWDHSECIPLLVRNKAAEVLFANITADKVYSCYKSQNQNQSSESKADHVMGHCEPRACVHPKSDAAGNEVAIGSQSPNVHDESLRLTSLQQVVKTPDFYRIWLILLKTLLQQGKNCPSQFEVAVNNGSDQENGRFELVSVKITCFKKERSYISSSNEKTHPSQ